MKAVYTCADFLCLNELPGTYFSWQSKCLLTICSAPYCALVSCTQGEPPCDLPWALSVYITYPTGCLTHTYSLQKGCLEKTQGLSSWGTGKGYHPESEAPSTPGSSHLFPTPGRDYHRNSARRLRVITIALGLTAVKDLWGSVSFPQATAFLRKGLNLKKKITSSYFSFMRTSC